MSIVNSQDVENLLERVKKFHNLRTDTQLAKFLGVGSSAISGWKKRVSPDMRLIISKCHGINYHWLITGEGEPTGTSVAVDYNSYRSLPVHALGGAGDSMDLYELEPIKKILIPREFHNQGIFAIMVRGDSMVPTIVDHAIVGIDTEDRNIRSGQIYAIRIPYEGVVIKRVFVELNRITLSSDNRNHRPFTIDMIDLDEGAIIGRVAWVVQRF